MATFQQVVNDFLGTYQDCPADNTGTPPVSALTLLNQADEEILAYLPLRKDEKFFGFTQYARTQDIGEEIVRVHDVDLLYPRYSMASLEATSEDHLSYILPGWRSAQGVPSRYYMTASSTSGQIGWYPAPDWTTLAVTNATNATPIVVTATAHGLSDNASIVIKGVLGNLAANGYFYVDVLTANTFALYSDSALSSPVAGTGAYTSGGYVGTTTHPIPCVYCSTRLSAALTAGDNMAAIPQLRSLYANKMRYLWALQNDPERVPMWSALVDSDLKTCQDMLLRRADDVQIEIIPFKQNRNFRNAQTTRNSFG